MSGVGLCLVKFNEIIRISVEDLEDIFNDFGDGYELVCFFILEGYIDDIYYQYMLLFYVGWMFLNDNKFLIKICGFIVLFFDFLIDNVKEVIVGMWGEDFW